MGKLTFTAASVTIATGATERCLHYWDRSGVVRPSEQANGAGFYRRYTATEVVLVSIVKRMRRAGVSLQQIRRAMPVIEDVVSGARSEGAQVHLQTGKGPPLLIITRMAGAENGRAVVDALKGGQLVLALAVEPVRKEVERRLRRQGFRPEAVGTG